MSEQYILCDWCGWGIHLHKGIGCKNSTEAQDCELNKGNVRKFCLRHRDQPVPNIVRSRRHQGPEGKGDSYEFLERVE